jgi:rhomboid protease GluP
MRHRYNKAVEKRRMCPNCRAFITTSDRVCPYCDAQLGPRAIDVRGASMASYLPRAYSTSIIILTINFALYIASVIVTAKGGEGGLMGGPSGQVLVMFGAKYGPFIIQGGQWWRLITAGFLHGGLLHILMNSWALYDLIAEVEGFYGTSRLIVAYVFTTFTGFFVSLLWRPMTLSVGASAACFGLIGIMLAIGVRRNDPLAQTIRAYYRRWAIYGLIFSFLPGIDIGAHLGGLAGGFALGLVAGLPGHPNSFRERFWQGAAVAAVAITLYAFFQDFHFSQIMSSQQR